MNTLERLVHFFDQADTRGVEFDWLRPIVEDARIEVCGSIRKTQLVHGMVYDGQSRIGRRAQWDATIQKFWVVLAWSYGNMLPVRHQDDEVAEGTEIGGFRPEYPTDPKSVAAMIEHNIKFPTNPTNK